MVGFFVVRRSAFSSSVFDYITGVLSKMVLRLNIFSSKFKSLVALDAKVAKLSTIEALLSRVINDREPICSLRFRAPAS